MITKIGKNTGKTSQMESPFEPDVERKIWRQIFLGPIDQLPAADPDATGYSDALIDVISEISAESALRLMVLQEDRAEDFVLSTALTNCRFDILEAALKRGWSPSEDFVKFALMYLSDASGELLQIINGKEDPEVNREESELKEFAQIAYWLFDHQLIREDQIPKWAHQRG